MDTLSFGELRKVNQLRHERHDDNGTERTWTLPEWTNALAGEAGELCNVAKKTRRGLKTDPTIDDARQEMAHELADIIIYADLVAQKLDIDLGAAVREKFNIVSDRRGSDLKL